MWDRLGSFAITRGTLRVSLSNNANGYVIADAVRIERVGDIKEDGVSDEPDTVPDTVIPEQENSEEPTHPSIDAVIDNGEAGYRQIGPWQRWTGFGHSKDVAQATAGLSNRIANWEFTVPSGVYDISTTWPAHANRAFQRSLRDLRCLSSNWWSAGRPTCVARGLCTERRDVGSIGHLCSQ